MSVVTRIAPSPTGDPHVGTAYQALFNSVFARQHAGKFIVRLEDTDRNRYNPESEGRILDMLDWLADVWEGLRPDASPRREDELGPYTQSQRAGLHRQYAEQLLGSGAAYRAFDTPEELDERRKAAEARKDSYLGYDRRDRALSREESDRRAAAGEPFVIRLAAPLDGETVIRDRLRGDVVFQNAELDDKVLLKRDGFPTYHLAAMVDDHLMGVTHVIRAEEWLTSTPIHKLILQGLGWSEPEWIHTPWLLSAGGKKYSKRRGDPSVEDFRKMGILPEALLNYLGMMGWSMPNGEEVFSPADMVEHFSWERVSLGGSTFDVEKLRWLNGKYIREVLSEGEVGRRLHAFGVEQGYAEGIANDAFFHAVVAMMLPRFETLAEFWQKTGYFFGEDYPVNDKAAKLIAEGRELLPKVRDALAALPDFAHDTTESALRALAETEGLKPGKVMQPLRAVLAGTSESPGMFEMLEALGKERVLGRLERALE
ncbi:glutamate--tRNA ligase [Deinococcus irradiatisoli]|uniref:Glutamate--tRNA ligase n=1 Tax=Deinococcus irradiatisoli TaxID=2202254 RepID=A0A2Z3JL11_9DEIO|nr:glutamate--tRNA ligase [Deinococcus irradiatisoli]AWN24596.1 glutamate--tRNA ligase [Deinococcus irradiatisoli]